MGCSAAKNLAVEPMNGNNANLNGLSDSRKVSIPRKNSDVPPLISTEPQTELLDNNSTINNFTKTSKAPSFLTSSHLFYSLRAIGLPVF